MINKEMSAIELAEACRYRGLDSVKALIEEGAKFTFPQTERIEHEYSVYAGINDENYLTNFSLYLLKIFKHIKGACCCKGLKLNKKLPVENGKPLAFLPDEERVKVLDYLYETREKTGFNPNELLFFAIFAEDDIIVAELKRLGVTISETRIRYITNGGSATDGYWYEWCSMVGNLNKENFIPIMEQIIRETGKPFHFTDWIFHCCENLYSDPRIFEFFLNNFKQDRMNKTKILRDLINNEATNVFPIIEKAGWLKNPKKRDEMIKYASDNDKTECTAWLMDFKNRTADFAAEREKAEKKMQRELNAAPNSVTALKQIWSYRKEKSGEITITNYKGASTEIVVPETIGKSTVTVIGNGAFATVSGRAGEVFTNATREQIAVRRQITKVTFPKTIKKIDIGAFDTSTSLKEIEIPDGVEEIGDFAFYECKSLTRIVIPGSVKRIGKYAFAYCKSLEEIIIREGVEEIDKCAFTNNEELRRIEIPASVKKLHIANYSVTGLCGILGNHTPACVVCPKGSEAEKHCAEFNYKIES